MSKNEACDCEKVWFLPNQYSMRCKKITKKVFFLLKSGKVTILLFFTLPQYSNLTGM